MMNIKMIGVVGVLVMILSGSTAQGKPGGPAVSAAPASAGQSVANPSSDASALGKPKDKPGTGQENKPDKPQHPDRPDHPDKPGKGNSTGDIQQMLEDIKAAQTKFLEDQKDLQDKLKKATKEEREKLRMELRDKREQFLQQQKEMREDFRKRVSDLKDQLKDHRDVIDDVKEKTKDKVRQRKGGDN